jgi:4-aminobutyrate aminotransferase/(S)-3-amino-2-methylpropionate transaminase
MSDTAAKEACGTANLAALRDRYVAQCYTNLHPMVEVRGEGAWIEDSAGCRYLDFAGGVGVLNVGQRHPRVVEAVHAQVDRLLHSGPVMLHDGYIALAARLAEAVPGDDNQVLFLNSGAEAVENAVKIARYATGRPAIIAFGGSFHGRTYLTSTMTGSVTPYKRQPGVLAPAVYHAVYPNVYRPPVGVAREQLVDYCLNSLECIVQTVVPQEQVAAVIVEPVQGEGGILVPPAGFLSGIRHFCDRIGALLIVDEVQTGYGRTGRMFAQEWEPVQPDITTLGKSIAGGLPLAAVVARRAIFEKVTPGDVGGTFTGSPLSCAAGLAVLDAFENEPLLENAATIESRARAVLDDLYDHYLQVGDVRGLGSMLAVEFVSDRVSKSPASTLVADIIRRARENGLIIIRCGPLATALRIFVPLIVDTNDLEEGMARLATAVVASCTDVQQVAVSRPAALAAAGLERTND